MNYATPEAIDFLLSQGQTLHFKKGSIISGPSHAYPMLYFVEDGLARGFIENLEQEHTLWVIQQGFILPSGGLICQRKSLEFVQFLKDTQTWSLNLSKATVLSKNSNEKAVLHQVLLEIYEEAIFDGKERELLLRLPQAKERYLRFKNRDNTLFYQLTIDILSSFLRMSRKQFSRIKNEDAHEK